MPEHDKLAETDELAPPPEEAVPVQPAEPVQTRVAAGRLLSLDFFRGQYSARAIQGGRPYPGKGDWRLAGLYYGTAVRLCAGTALAIIGLLGTLVLLARRAIWPLALLALPPLPIQETRVATAQTTRRGT